MAPGQLAGVVEISPDSFDCHDRSELRRILHTSPVRYLKSKDYFENHCSTMMEFLRWYNLLDCELLVQAITKYADGFLTEWQTNVHEFKSVSIQIIFDFGKFLSLR